MAAQILFEQEGHEETLQVDGTKNPLGFNYTQIVIEENCEWRK